MSSENVFKTSLRRLGQDQYIRLGHTSSRRVQDVFMTSCQDFFKTFSRRLATTSSRRFEGVFKTSSRRLAKTSSIHLAKTSSRHLQDAFKTYHQVKLFLLTRLRELFNTFLRCSFPKTYFSQSNTTSEKFMVSYKTCKRDENFPSFSFSL